MNIGAMIENELGEMLTQYLRPVAHAEVVVNCPPVWVRAAGAEFFFGIKRDFLNGLVAAKKVTAKKADKLVVYKFSDIEQAIASMKDYRKGN